MMVKVFTVNKNDKIEFTKDELEKLLNEVWEDGRRDGLNSNKNYWWTSPTITCTTLTQGSTSSTNESNAVPTAHTIDNYKCEF